VERDGSGDYSVIQEAVNVAASGDTIRIGPGRFDEKHWVVRPGWSEYVRVDITKNELTLFGSGPETIIGQEEPWDASQGSDKGIATGDLGGNNILRVEGIRFENMRDGIYTSYEFTDGCVFEVRNCTFSRNYDSLWLLGTNATVLVENCDFVHLADTGIHLVAWGQQGLEVTGCRFWMDASVYGQYGISLNGVNNSEVINCEFFSGTIGLAASFGTPLVVRDCLFDGQGVVSVTPNDIVVGTIDGCIFKNSRRAIKSSAISNDLTITNSVFENVLECSIVIRSTGGLSVQNCDLAKGSNGVAYILDNPPCSHTGVIDMTNNYWGTDNPDSIRAWIWDSNDSEDACYSVDFEPFESESTPAEKQSLGGFRAMFR